MICHEEEPRTVSTILTVEERLRVDAAGVGHYRAIHRRAVGEVVQDVTAGRTEALILSVRWCQEYDQHAIRKLIAEVAPMPTIGLISSTDTETPEMLVRLGRWGLTTVIDVRSPNGWTVLRRCIVDWSNDTVEAMIFGQIRKALPNGSRGTMAFFDLLLRTSRLGGSVRSMCEQLGLLPSTLMSRFFRAGLPAPRQYLTTIRLIRAAYLLQNPGFSIANVANHLHYSSPQSFGRHVRVMTGLSALTFRKQQTVESLVDEFLANLVLPFKRTFDTFEPLTTFAFQRNR